MEKTMLQSAGVAVIDWSTPEPSVLCVRAYANWDFPKGKLDPGETRFQAALRELEEETSLMSPTDVIAYEAEHSEPIVYGKGSRKKTAVYFVGARQSQTVPFLPISEKLGKPENDEFRWVPMSKLAALMPGRLQSVVQFVLDTEKRANAR